MVVKLSNTVVRDVTLEDTHFIKKKSMDSWNNLGELCNLMDIEYIYLFVVQQTFHLFTLNTYLAFNSGGGDYQSHQLLYHDSKALSF